PRRWRPRHRRSRAHAARRRAPAGSGFRATRTRIFARGGDAPPPRLCARDRQPVDGGGRARRGGAPHAQPRCRLRGPDRGVAVAGARSAPAAGGPGCARQCERRCCARGGAMQTVPASRFVAADRARRIRVSFEFFPPKTEEMERTLWESISRLAPLAPSFVSVTYGAGGSTRERTHATVKRILAETALVPAAHPTCVAATCDDIDAVIRAYHEAGVRHIVALRGDPPGGAGERYAPHPGGYRNGADLVAGIKRIADVEVSVSAYPEKHPDSPSVEADIDMLKAKVDAGATRAMTQFFFENDLYFRYLERVRARGIRIPIVPGILPVQNFKQAKNF